MPVNAAANAHPAPDAPVILFDGDCAMCNRSVAFILRHEREPWCSFASLQSPIGRELIASHGMNPDALDSIVYIERAHALLRSHAVLRIAAHLRAPYRWASVLALVPRVVRDAMYRLIAKNRHRMFGPADACFVPAPENRNRFLDLL